MNTIFLLFTFINISLAYKYYEAEVLRPCPKVLPLTDVDLKQLEGSWHLSLIILDAATENLEESTVCVTGQVHVYNTTHMKQTWDMYTPSNPNDPVGNMELSVEVVRPGVWAVQTPLGSQISGTLFGYEDDLVMVAHCGWHKGNLVHLWTGGATRNNNKLSPEMRIRISTLLLHNSYDPSTTKIITWNKSC